MKQCRTCGEPKELSAYYVHSQMADGHLNICIECTKARINKERNEHLEKHRLRDATRYYESESRQKQCHAGSKTESAKLLHREVCKRHDARYPEKYKARNMAANAIRDGKLVRGPCEVCGKKAQAHHDAYSTPLDVRWLCPKHHGLEHRKYDF